MGPAATIEGRIGVQRQPDSGPDTYTSEQPLTYQPTGRAVFGGLLISQAISAASATVRPGFHIYSSHSSFLRPVTASARDRVLYHVDPVADSRSYATRVVRATQCNQDACVYMATIAYQRSDATASGNVVAYSPPMPDLDGLAPSDVPADANRKLVEDGLSADSLLRALSTDDEPFDYRLFNVIAADDPTEYRVRSFVRAAQPLSSNANAATHAAAMAYMSDEGMLAIAILGSLDQLGDRFCNLAMAASLHHRVSFHDPAVARADAWMVLERETSWGGDGRVMMHQRTWDLETGRLIMTCEQEALIRLKGSDSKL
ncbi:acyl-CoA thioesterase II [Apiospora saccharicola]